MALPIKQVHPGSLAERAGLLPGDVLQHINREAVLDEVDFQYLTAQEQLTLAFSRGGQPLTASLRKAAEAPLGIEFASDLMQKPKQCANRCVFCFIDQMPPGLRTSLYVKDDDWRLSLKTGNFITLTNLPESELQRIIDRQASPLYISVHATDAALRRKMMGHQHAGQLLDHLRRFARAGIRFHCQVVLCPGWNDGAALEQTLADLYALFPAALSVALVPVGLTKFREGLAALRPFTADEARQVFEIAEAWRAQALAEHGTRWVFPADEFYQTAGLPVPPYEHYENFAQIENGVGLLRLLENEFSTAARLDPEQRCRPRRVALVTGTSAAPFLRQLIATQPLTGVQITVYPIANHFFGETVTVAGLVTGQDIMNQMRGVAADEILLPGSMLRAGEDVFLDGTPLAELEAALGIPVRVVPPDGAELLYALRGTEE